MQPGSRSHFNIKPRDDGETDILLITGSSSAAEIRSVHTAQSYVPDKTALLCSCIPSRKKHLARGKIGISPQGKLRPSPKSDNPADGIEIDSDGYEIYVDEAFRKWRKLPKKNNLCHCCRYERLILYDEDIGRKVNMPKKGMTEIRIAMNEEGQDFIHSMTYNYFDKSFVCGHFWADIFPVFLYCSNPRRILNKLSIV